MRTAALVLFVSLVACVEQPTNPDAPELVDAQPDGGTWACDPILDTGCEAGFTCRIGTEPSCVAVMGALTEGALRCYDPASMRDQCEAGLFCTGGSFVCRQYCDPNGAPCPSGRHCDVELFGPINDIGVGVCLPD